MRQQFSSHHFIQTIDSPFPVKGFGAELEQSYPEKPQGLADSGAQRKSFQFEEAIHSQNFMPQQTPSPLIEHISHPYGIRRPKPLRRLNS